MENITGDGFASRKFIFSVGTVAVVEVCSVVGWALDRMTASEWIGLNQWLVPMALAIYAGANVAEQLIALKKPS